MTIGARRKQGMSVCVLIAGMTGLLASPAMANKNAADTTNASDLWPGAPAGYSLSGAGVTVGVWEANDGGDWEVRDTHEAFTHGLPPGQSRVRFGDSADGGYSSHATHVAATIGGAHIPGKEDSWGMAPGVQIISFSAGSDTYEMRQEYPEVDITNHSYGVRLGGWSTRSWDIPDGQGGIVSKKYATWYYNRDQYDEDPTYGRYTYSSYDLDRTLVERPKLLSFWSAGNERAYGYSDKQGDGKYVVQFSTDYINNVGVVGTPLTGRYYLVHKDDYGIPDHDGPKGKGYDSLAYDKNAKNSVVVGAVKDHTGDPHSPGGIRTEGFSSYGPSDDGRIGVDIVANGSGLKSATDKNDTSYGGKSGTSMSSPNAAGTAALVLEHWRNRLGGYTPDAATQKGLLMHTATDATRDGQVGPDYRTGYGLINAMEAVELIDEAVTAPDATREQHLWEEQLIDGDVVSKQFVATGGPVKASLSWLDPAVSDYQSGLDDRTPALVNDLDLWFTDAWGNLHFPWTLDPDNPAAPATRDKLNHVDNFVQVLIDDIDPGAELTLHIGHTGDLLDASQRYGLFVSGATLIPEPMTAMVMLMLGAAAAMRRRR